MTHHAPDPSTTVTPDAQERSSYTRRLLFVAGMGGLLPETKGKTLEEIEQYFERPKAVAQPAA